MAQDIGLLLRGLGASFSQQVPQFRQEMAQEQELARQQQLLAEQQSQRQRQAQIQDVELQQKVRAAGYQDAFALGNLLKGNNIEAGLGLLEDRLNTIEQLGINLSGDPTMMIYEDLRLAATGDAEALRRAQMRTALAVAEGIDRGELQLPEATKGVVVNGRLVNPTTGEVIYESPAEAETTYELLPPQEVERLGLPAGSYQRNRRTGQYARVGAPDTVVNVGAATEGERVAGTLAGRMDFAQSQIKNILSSAPEAAKPAIGATALNALGLEYLARVSNPAERQIIEAAQTDLLDSALTLSTGAAYTKEQIEGYRTSFFPQIGDDPRTVTAKAERLNNLINGAYQKAGRAAPSERRGNQAQAPQRWFDYGLTQEEWNTASEDERRPYLEAQ
jgi:hypothetical protein